MNPTLIDERFAIATLPDGVVVIGDPSSGMPPPYDPSGLQAQLDALADRTTLLELATFVGEGSAALTIVGMTATYDITGGGPETVAEITWGDSTDPQPVGLDSAGDGSGSHTYAVAGSFATLVRDAVGLAIAAEMIVV